MLWTLGAFLLILSLLLVQFLKKVVDTVKKSYFAYPSDAVIDQALPQEIMEHVMTFLDPRAMMECRVVSKYWRYHAMKQRVEIAVIDHARQRLREVYQELKENGISIHDQQVESIIQHSTKDPFFVRASALAGKHGADLIVAGSELFRDIISHIMWPALKAKKKHVSALNRNALTDAIIRYFGLTSGYTSDIPWKFSLAGEAIHTTVMFDKTAVDWDDTPHYDLAEILVDMTPLPGYNLSGVKLYSFRSFNLPKYFYFVPLNDKMFHALIFLFAPLIVHDALYSNYLPTIKSWFGQLMYIGGAILQLLMISNFTRNHRPTTSFKLTLLTYIALYVLLTCIFYRASMSVFTGIGILTLIFFYFIVLREYFFPMHTFTKNKKKRKLFFIGVSLIFFMIDWKLVVTSLMDLTFFRALFENTFNYSMVMLMFIFYNFLGQVKRYGFDLRRVLNWERHTFMTLVNSYSFVVLMTLVAPTWRGNY